MSVMDEELQAILAELRCYFERLYGPRLVRLVLFGSQARGDAEPGSDIDVLIVLKGPINQGEEGARSMSFVADLSLRFDTVVSCLYMDEERYRDRNGPLLRNIRREGIAV